MDASRRSQKKKSLPSRRVALALFISLASPTSPPFASRARRASRRPPLPLARHLGPLRDAHLPLLRLGRFLLPPAVHPVSEPPPERLDKLRREHVRAHVHLVQPGVRRQQRRDVRGTLIGDLVPLDVEAAEGRVLAQRLRELPRAVVVHLVVPDVHNLERRVLEETLRDVARHLGSQVVAAHVQHAERAVRLEDASQRPDARAIAVERDVIHRDVQTQEADRRTRPDAASSARRRARRVLRRSLPVVRRFVRRVHLRRVVRRARPLLLLLLETAARVETARVSRPTLRRVPRLQHPRERLEARGAQHVTREVEVLEAVDEPARARLRERLRARLPDGVEPQL